MDDVYEVPAHTFDDDGYQARCMAGGQYCTPNLCTGEIVCPDCGATLTAILIAG